jgi:aspartate dehydrogenase
MQTSPASSAKVKVGILGFGLIGQYIARRILDASHPQTICDTTELTFVWNRTSSKLRGQACVDAIGCEVPESSILEDLDALEVQFPQVDVIVEVAHPNIYTTHGERLLRHSSVYVGSPTAFADRDVSEKLKALVAPGHALYFPSGALWGANDVLKMGNMRTLAAVSITMRKPPHSFRLEEPLQSALQSYIDLLDNPETHKTAPSSFTLYDGPVRGICPLAPNNVNTMACLAVASGEEVGFDHCRGILIADATVAAHVIDITIRGKPIAGRDDVFEVSTRRYNPCDPNQVTATATYPSFLSSLKNIIAKGGFIKAEGGIHFV